MRCLEAKPSHPKNGKGKMGKERARREGGEGGSGTDKRTRGAVSGVRRGGGGRVSVQACRRESQLCGDRQMGILCLKTGENHLLGNETNSSKASSPGGSAVPTSSSSELAQTMAKASAAQIQRTPQLPGALRWFTSAKTRLGSNVIYSLSAKAAGPSQPHPRLLCTLKRV